jgi:hypothetical protein
MARARRASRGLRRTCLAPSGRARRKRTIRAPSWARVVAEHPRQADRDGEEPRGLRREVLAVGVGGADHRDEPLERLGRMAEAAEHGVEGAKRAVVLEGGGRGCRGRRAPSGVPRRRRSWAGVISVRPGMGSPVGTRQATGLRPEPHGAVAHPLRAVWQAARPWSSATSVDAGRNLAQDFGADRAQSRWPRAATTKPSGVTRSDRKDRMTHAPSPRWRRRRHPTPPALRAPAPDTSITQRS